MGRVRGLLCAQLASPRSTFDTCLLKAGMWSPPATPIYLELFIWMRLEACHELTAIVLGNFTYNVSAFCKTITTPLYLVTARTKRKRLMSKSYSPAASEWRRGWLDDLLGVNNVSRISNHDLKSKAFQGFSFEERLGFFLGNVETFCWFLCAARIPRIQQQHSRVCDGTQIQ